MQTQYGQFRAGGATLRKVSAAMIHHVFAAMESNDHWARVARAIKRELPQAAILRVRDGDQAARFLFQQGLLTLAPQTPDLVVIGADLQRLSAAELSRQIFANPRTRLSPVIVLSSGDPAAFEVPVHATSRLIVVDLAKSDFESALSDAIRRTRLAAQPSALRPS